MIESVLRMVLSLLALVINIILAYFAIRLIFIFKGGRAALPWRYISAGALALATASTLFISSYLLNLRGFEHFIMHFIGGVIMVIGGLLVLVGLYTEYKSWIGR